jgi:hypothetical protein
VLFEPGIIELLAGISRTAFGGEGRGGLADQRD